MNHKITIKNLGPIKDIKDFEVKKVNLLIGKSASGKSVLAKAIFLFNFIIENIEHTMFFHSQSNLVLRNQITELLHEFFPQYRGYTIKYKYTNNFFINVEMKHRNASITFSSKFEDRFKKYDTEISEFKEIRKIFKQETLFEETDRNSLLKRYRIAEDSFASLKSDLNILKTIFIPATRSVVSDFDRSRLKMLNEPRNFDKKNLSTEFLEAISEGDITLKLFSGEHLNIISQFKELPNDFEKIIKGRLKKEGEQIVLTTESNNKQKLTVNQLSSGQKEAIPILMFLQNIADNEKEILLIIEEPEVNLFPEDQRLLFEQIIAVVNKTNSKVFITTHSPFLLMNTNNLITAKEKQYKKLEKIFISFEDVQAHKLENGTSKSIKNTKNHLVSGRYIEQVTDTIMEQFENILES